MKVFPDIHFDIDDLIVKGDGITRLTAQGTHAGEMLGIVPPGERVTWSSTVISRVADDKIVEHWWNIFDEQNLMDKLGIVSIMVAC